MEKHDVVFHGEMKAYRDGVPCEIGKNCYVGPGTTFYMATGIFIGDDVMISWGCTLLDTDMHSLDWQARSKDMELVYNDSWQDKDWSVVRSAPIRIHDKVWIGAQSMILAGAVIGEGAVIGAGSVVRGYVAPWSLYAGNPARFVRKLATP